MNWLGIYSIGEKLYAQLATVDMVMDVSAHAYPPEVASHHIDSVVDTLVSFCIVEFYNNERC